MLKQIKITTNDLTDRQLIELMRRRMKNLKCEGIKSIKIIWRSSIGDGFRCLIKYKNWADEESGMTLTKFYLNEVQYLISQDIL